MPDPRYAAAIATIDSRADWDRGFIANPFVGDAAAKLGLTRTRAVLDAMDAPDRALRLIHIAGSKGKGSTAVVTDTILRAAGVRTGRYTSPHLHDWRERFVVDGEPIATATFADRLERTMIAVEVIETTQPGLGRVTAFELTTAMAFLVFAEAGCAIAVIEVGLGGTLDATNVITPVASFITRLDLEHTAILGDTLPEIAANKAGIIKTGRPAFTVAQDPAALAVIQARADEVGARLAVAGRDWTVTGDDREFSVQGQWGTTDRLMPALAGVHQVENAALAIAGLKMTPALPAIDDDAIRTGLRNVVHPGRFEVVAWRDVTVVLDGAHTPVAASALADTLRAHYPEETFTVVLGMLRDKTVAGFLEPLRPFVASWILVEPPTPRAMPVTELAGVLATPHATATSIASALDLAAQSGHPILVTGSLTMIAPARTYLGLT